MRARFWPALVFLVGCAASSAPPIPQDMKIVPPGPDVPRELAALSGKWYGKWEGVLEHILIVETVRAEQVIVIFSYGKSDEWHVTVPGWNRLACSVEGRDIRCAGLESTYTYRLTSDGGLDGTFERGPTVRHIHMTRVLD